MEVIYLFIDLPEGHLHLFKPSKSGVGTDPSIFATHHISILWRFQYWFVGEGEMVENAQKFICRYNPRPTIQCAHDNENLTNSQSKYPAIHTQTYEENLRAIPPSNHQPSHTLCDHVLQLHSSIALLLPLLKASHQTPSNSSILSTASQSLRISQSRIPASVIWTARLCVGGFAGWSDVRTAAPRSRR